MFIEALFIIAKEVRTQIPNDKQNMVHPYNGTFSHKKRRSTVKGHNMEERWIHYAKWNQTDTKGQIYASTYVRYQGQASSWGQNVCMIGVTRRWGRGVGSYILWAEFLFGRMKKFWKRILRWLRSTVNTQEPLNRTLRTHEFGMWMIF